MKQQEQHHSLHNGNVEIFTGYRISLELLVSHCVDCLLLSSYSIRHFGAHSFLFNTTQYWLTISSDRLVTHFVVSMLGL